MRRAIHVFDNGVKVYDDHLIPSQRGRYRKRNVHEAEEEDVFVEIVRSLPGEGCFVNIGSAIGYYPLLAKRLSPGLTIHTVEPLEQHRRCFIENVRLNGLPVDAFVLHAQGISASGGPMSFVDAGYASAIQHDETPTKPPTPRLLKTLRAWFTRKSSRTRTLTIPTITLDGFMDTISASADLVQMDVQGAELDVLKGAERSLEAGTIVTFLVGTHSPELHQQCIELLSKHGYSIELDRYETEEQPDGILVASKGVTRLKASRAEA
jgi:FkbM family methyltransferase